jgi:hypothetical protein
MMMTLKLRNAYDWDRATLVHATKRCIAKEEGQGGGRSFVLASTGCCSLLLNVTTLVDAMSSTDSDEQVMKQIRARLMETGDWQR